ncbi:MAG: hypothetical protein H6636_05890 [Anaerolineales bacterium]|nr:hypothetical protein [Anaerolineales bacterium]
MKTFIKFVLLTLVIGGIAFAGAFLNQEKVAAGEGDPPVRKAELLVTFTQYQWWLTRWADNQTACAIFIEHEGQPTNLEVLANCGEDLYDEWLVTPACPPAVDGGDTSSCDGLYVFLADIQPGQRKVVIDLPVPTIWLTLNGCTPTPPQNECSQIPSLVFEAEEPLPNEVITAMHVKLEGSIYDCASPRCEIPMTATPLIGSEVEFWADSSYGDQSEHFTARVRIVDAGVQPGGKMWYVDVISSQWQGDATVNSCAATWEAFPPIGEPPHWLSTPLDAAGLSSNTPYAFLAGQLIQQRIVDASQCESDGLLENGAANACGVEQARSVITDWQNQFDTTIFEVAQRTTIPAQLLKNIFAQESQFWPGEIINDEFGLGQLTSAGAEGPLMWNPSFFEQFCPLVLHEETCAKGYLHIEPEYQAMLQGALATMTNANCPECEQGIDLVHAQSSVDVFAQLIQGNCEQVSYMVYDITGKSPGAVASYEDLWRFTLVNYNAGPGCLTYAMRSAWNTDHTIIQWDTVKTRFPIGCPYAVQYVDRVTRDRSPADADFLTPSPTPTVRPTSTPTLTRTPTQIPSQTLTPTITPTPTVTETPTP